MNAGNCKAVNDFQPSESLPDGPLDLVQLQSQARVVTERAPNRSAGASGLAEFQLYSICLRASRVQDLLTGKCKRGGCRFVIQSRQKPSEDPEHPTAHTFTDVVLYHCNRGPADKSGVQPEAVDPEQQQAPAKRRRKDGPSIKVGCKVRFSVREPAVAPGVVVVKWPVGGTQHVGHGTEADAAIRGVADLFPTHLSEACRAWAAQQLRNNMSIDADVEENCRRIMCICPTEEELQAHPQLWRNKQLCKSDLYNLRRQVQQQRQQQQQQQQQQAAHPVSDDAADGEALPPTSTAAAGAVASAAAAAQATGSSAAADAASRRRDVQAEFDRALADVRQLAGLSDELLAAAVPLLQNVCKSLRQLAAREAEAGMMHPASQMVLTQLHPHGGSSKRRRQPAWCGGQTNKRPKQKQQASMQQESAARARPWCWAGTSRVSVSRAIGPAAARAVSHGKGGADGSTAANGTAAAVQAGAAQQRLALAAGASVQQQLPPQPGRLGAQGELGAGMATALPPLLQGAQPGTSAAAWPAAQPLDMLGLFQSLPPNLWPVAVAALGQWEQPVLLPPPALMPQLAAFLAQQQPVKAVT